MSALKTWILFVAVVFWVVGCSDDSNPHAVSIDDIGDTGSSASSGGSSGSKSNGSSGSAKPGSSAAPIVINGGKDTIYVADAEGSLYYSSGVFCWTESCEIKYASASSNKSSSSTGTKPTGSSSSTGSQPKSSSSKQSSSSQAPTVSVDSRAPTFDKTGMKLTDNRDGKVYEVDKIGTTYWMTSNLLYKPNTGYQCGATVQVETKPGPEAQKDTVNVCDRYGVYYTYNAKDVVCPSGWRLPTKDEVNKALVSMGGDKETTDKEAREKLDEWWVRGGRFKLDGTNWLFGNNDGQGHLWIQKSSADEVAIRYQDYGSRWEVPKFVTYDDQTEKRAYNVRCVMTE
ncbi:MAG: hypothetical protein IJ909_07105 [Fibrobacter sp.]|nr:hypothetical protein [Fibrobacter sp.]